MTAWTDFVKKYAAEKGISYKAALSQASEPYKNSKAKKGTVQVKRNVAQRGLAEIASAAKKGVETKKGSPYRTSTNYGTKKAKKQEFIKRTGIPEDVLQTFVDLIYVSDIYRMQVFDKTPKNVREALRTLQDKLLQINLLIPTRGNEVITDYFDPLDLENNNLGINEYSDAKGVYYWDDDAADDIKFYSDQGDEILEEIFKIVDNNAPDPRLERKYVANYGKYFWALKKPDKFGFTPIWPFSDGTITSPIAIIKNKSQDYFFRFDDYPNRAVEAFYKEVEKFANRGSSLKMVLDKFF